MLAQFPAHRDFPSLVWPVCFAAISGSLWHTLSLSALNAGRLSGQSPSSLQPLVSRAATSCLSHPGSCSLPLVASWSQGVGERELLVCVPSHTFWSPRSTSAQSLPSWPCCIRLLQPSHGTRAANLGASRDAEPFMLVCVQEPWEITRVFLLEDYLVWCAWKCSEGKTQNRKRKRDFWIFKAGLVW